MNPTISCMDMKKTIKQRIKKGIAPWSDVNPESSYRKEDLLRDVEELGGKEREALKKVKNYIENTSKGTGRESQYLSYIEELVNSLTKPK